MGQALSTALAMCVGASPVQGVYLPTHPDQAGDQDCGLMTPAGRQAGRGSSLPHLGSSLLWMLGLRALLPDKVKGHPAAAAVIAAAVVLAWRMLPDVSDAALLKSEQLLLNYVKAERRHKFTLIATRHGVFYAHSIHLAPQPLPVRAAAGTGGTTMPSSDVPPAGSATSGDCSPSAVITPTNSGIRGNILVLHGHSAGVGVWGKVLHRLQRPGYVVHALDLPGWGRSTGPALLETADNPDVILDMYIEFLEQWRIANKLTKLTVVSHSFGAYLTSFWARKHPDAIDHVLLMAPAGCFPVMPEDSYRGALAFSMLTPQRFSKIMGRLGLALFRAGNTLFADDLDPEMVDYYYQLAAASKRMSGAGDRACAKFITFKGLTTVWARPAVGVVLGLRQHVTLVFGENDPIVPARFGSLLRELRPRGMNVFRVNDAAHNPAHCRPGAFKDTVHMAIRLYEERVKQEMRRARHRQAHPHHHHHHHRQPHRPHAHSLPKIIHSSQQVVKPTCTTCGQAVKQSGESLQCGCGSVTFYATMSRRATAQRILEMESTYRKLYVGGNFSFAAVDPKLAMVIPRGAIPNKRRHNYWWGSSHSLAQVTSDHGTVIVPSDGNAMDTSAAELGSEATLREAEGQEVTQAAGEGAEPAAEATAAAVAAEGDGDGEGCSSPPVLTEEEQKRIAEHRHRRKMSEAMLRVHEHHTGENVEI